jgi:hypothetical protein
MTFSATKANAIYDAVLEALEPLQRENERRVIMSREMSRLIEAAKHRAARAAAEAYQAAAFEEEAEKASARNHKERTTRMIRCAAAVTDCKQWPSNVKRKGRMIPSGVVTNQGHIPELTT